MDPNKKKAIEALTTLLHSELAAVESYDKALDRVKETRRTTLIGCQASHSRRVTLLNQRLSSLGSDVVLIVGQWETLIVAVTTGSGFLGERGVIAALMDGEDGVRDTYCTALKQCESLTAQFAATQLIPDMNRTHEAISTMHRQVK